MFVLWDNKYNIGIEKIDSQHKYLVSLANNLYQTIMNQYADDAISSVYQSTIDELFKYIEEHFNTEERFFKATNYPEYAVHVAQHNEFKFNISMFDIDPKKINATEANKLLVYLRDWFLSHIAIDDKAFAFYLQKLKKTNQL